MDTENLNNFKSIENKMTSESVFALMLDHLLVYIMAVI